MGVRSHMGRVGKRGKYEHGSGAGEGGVAQALHVDANIGQRAAEVEVEGGGEGDELQGANGEVTGRGKTLHAASCGAELARMACVIDK